MEESGETAEVLERRYVISNVKQKIFCICHVKNSHEPSLLRNLSGCNTQRSSFCLEASGLFNCFLQKL